MNDIAPVIVTLLIIWQAYMLVAKQRRKRNAARKAPDVHIEFGGQGEGIELVKKQYPELQLRDDHRTGIEESKGHSIANGMNDSDRASKANYIKENRHDPEKITKVF